MLTDERTDKRTETCTIKSPMLKQVRQKNKQKKNTTIQLSSIAVTTELSELLLVTFVSITFVNTEHAIPIVQFKWTAFPASMAHWMMCLVTQDFLEPAWPPMYKLRRACTISGASVWRLFAILAGEKLPNIPAPRITIDFIVRYFLKLRMEFLSWYFTVKNNASFLERQNVRRFQCHLKNAWNSYDFSDFQMPVFIC